MLVFRCTQKLLTRLRAKPIEPPSRSTTRLGDWYVGALSFGDRRLLMFLSEPTFLAVIIDAAESKAMMPRFRTALDEVLHALGVNEVARARERDEGGTLVFAKTESRQALGVMNDFVRLTTCVLDDCPTEPLLQVSLFLSRTPCGPLGQDYPADVVREQLMSNGPADRSKKA